MATWRDIDGYIFSVTLCQVISDHHHDAYSLPGAALSRDYHNNPDVTALFASISQCRTCHSSKQ